jgi:Ser/Thr protein kinase RdoA (MazF antagonist)
MATLTKLRNQRNQLEKHFNNREIKFLDRDPPHFSEEEARRIARELYDLTGNFKSLKSERDQNFRIRMKNGESYVLKLSNAGEDLGVIDFQCQALWHIERQDPELGVPRVVRTKEGDAFTTISHDKGTQHIVRVLTYLPGVILNDVPSTAALWRSVGKIAGRMDLALLGFFHPYARQEHPWDITLCAQLQPHTHHIADDAARKNIENVLGHMTTNILPRLKRLRHQVIHADIDGNNTLTDPDHLDSVTGIIDFGDMIFAPTIIEAVIAADVEGVPDHDLIDSIGSVVAGFDSIVPLEEEEIDLVYDLVLGRLAITATIIAWRKVMTPDQPDYIHESEEPCW